MTTRRGAQRSKRRIQPSNRNHPGAATPNRRRFSFAHARPAALGVRQVAKQALRWVFQRQKGALTVPTDTQTTNTASRVGALEAIFHLPRTLKVAGATLQDQRVGLMPKIMFVGSILLLILALLAPELGIDGFLAATGVGTLFDAVGIPVEGGLDWLAVAVAAVNLMKLFPVDVVNEHLSNAKSKGKPTGKVVDADPNK